MDRNVILDLCGGTGAWSKPYKDAGYTAELITLPRYDVTRVEFSTYAMQFWRRDVRYRESMTVLYDEIVGILAAPPCTEFSIAKGALPRDLPKAMEIVEACMRIIWETQRRTRLDFWALENPRGLLRRFLGIPKFTFEQWQFGGDKVKSTDIWGISTRRHQRTKKNLQTEPAAKKGAPTRRIGRCRSSRLSTRSI